MLIHELFQEQVIEERKRETEAYARRTARGDRPRNVGVPTFARTLIPALTHGLFGIPAPARTAHGGC